MSRIKCGGASLTAKLALGGSGFGDVDATTLMPNPPLIKLSKMLWDRPQFRAGVVTAWCKFHERHRTSSPAKAWASVRRPVGAAYAHMIELGATWEKPFSVIVLGHPVNLLTTPPLQLQALLREHARLHLDASLLEHLCAQHAWPAQAVMHTYRNGIDWSLIRRVLNGKIGEQHRKTRA